MATGKITSLIYENKTLSATAGANITLRTTPRIARYGKIVSIMVYFDTTATISNNGTIIRATSSLPLPVGSYAVAPIRSVSGSMGMLQLETANPTYLAAWGSIPTGEYYYCELIYITVS